MRRTSYSKGLNASGKGGSARPLPSMDASGGTAHDRERIHRTAPKHSQRVHSAAAATARKKNGSSRNDLAIVVIGNG